VVDALQVYAANGGRLGRKKFCSEMARMGYEDKRYRVDGTQVHSFKGLRLVMTEFGG